MRIIINPRSLYGPFPYIPLYNPVLSNTPKPYTPIISLHRMLGMKTSIPSLEKTLNPSKGLCRGNRVCIAAVKEFRGVI